MDDLEQLRLAIAMGNIQLIDAYLQLKIVRNLLNIDDFKDLEKLVPPHLINKTIHHAAQIYRKYLKETKQVIPIWIRLLAISRFRRTPRPSRLLSLDEAYSLEKLCGSILNEKVTEEPFIAFKIVYEISLYKNLDTTLRQISKLLKLPGHYHYINFGVEYVQFLDERLYYINFGDSYSQTIGYSTWTKDYIVTSVADWLLMMETVHHVIYCNNCGQYYSNTLNECSHCGYY